MKISINDLKNECQWRSATGYKAIQFKNLLSIFISTHFKIFGKTLPEKQADGPKESVIKTEEDLLFFTLSSLKSARRPVPTYLRPARTCGWHGWFKRKTKSQRRTVKI